MATHPNNFIEKIQIFHKLKWKLVNKLDQILVDDELASLVELSGAIKFQFDAFEDNL